MSFLQDNNPSSEDSLRYYKGEGYGDINSALRSQFTETIPRNIQKHIENIDRKMDKGSKNIRVYRGIPAIKRFIGNDETLIIPNLGYSSVTTDINVAKRFTVDSCCIISFILPADMGRYDYKDSDEKELLVQRNTQLLLDIEDISDLDSKTFFNAVIAHYDTSQFKKALSQKALAPSKAPSVLNASDEEIITTARNWSDELIELLDEDEKQVVDEQMIDSDINTRKDFFLKHGGTAENLAKIKNAMMKNFNLSFGHKRDKRKSARKSRKSARKSRKSARKSRKSARKARKSARKARK
jgi:hypothetical protein